EVALESYWGRLAVFLDDVEGFEDLPDHGSALFAAVRECSDRRELDPALYRLAFCFLGAPNPASVAALTFCRPVPLDDFTEPEAASLAAGLGCHRDTETQREGEEGVQVFGGSGVQEGPESS